MKLEGCAHCTTSVPRPARRMIPAGWFRVTISTNTGAVNSEQMVKENFCSIRCIEGFVRKWAKEIRC